jgi:ribonuclease P protein component
MLPARYRMRSSVEFSATTRRGRRTRVGDLVLYLGRSAETGEADTGAPDTTKVGLIVGRTVGGSVVRHQVSRRLRAQLAGLLDQLPAGSRLVVRALPGAATAGSATLGRDLQLAVSRLTTGTRR